MTDIVNTPETENELGLTSGCSLKFRQHIGTVVKKTNQMIGLIRHTFKHMDCTVQVYLYSVSEATSRLYQHGQLRAIKLVPELRNLVQYIDRLKHLNLPSLECQRRGGMIQAYQILQGTNDINKDDFFTTNTQSTHSHKEKLYKTPSRLNIRNYTFLKREFQDWNDLPPSAIEAPNILVLKKT